MKKANLKWILSATVAAAMLAACGGGVSPTPVSTNTTTAVTAATVAGIAGTPYTFAGGVAEFGTTASTTLAVTSAASGTSFEIGSGGKTASGPMTFGSCIFTITKSDFVAPSPLVVGAKITITNCKVDIKSAGYSAGTQSIPTVLTLGTAKSGDVVKQISVDANGDPKVGTITLTGTGS